MKKLAFITLAVMASVVLVPMTRAADENINGRIVNHNLKTETIEVGDIPGHVLGVVQQSGLIFYSTGEIATTTNTAYFDYVNGKGTFTNYRVSTFQDGSMLFTKGGGTATPADGGKRTVFEGPVECTGGTGRFEGYRGAGTYKGERVGSLKTGSDSYHDFTMSCRKP